jgi:glucokinase
LKAVGTFARLLGALAGDHALTFLPTGGIYLIGGMVLATSPWFKSAGFETAFARKGRFSAFMRQFPVYVVTDDAAALTGSAAYLVATANSHSGTS